MSAQDRPTKPHISSTEVIWLPTGLFLHVPRQLCCFLGPEAALGARGEATTESGSLQLHPHIAHAESSPSVLRAFGAAPASAWAGFNGERAQSALDISKIQSPEEILKIRVENIGWVDWKVIDRGMKLITCRSRVVSDITSAPSSRSV